MHNKTCCPVSSWKPKVFLPRKLYMFVILKNTSIFHYEIKVVGHLGFLFEQCTTSPNEDRNNNNNFAIYFVYGMMCEFGRLPLISSHKWLNEKQRSFVLICLLLFAIAHRFVPIGNYVHVSLLLYLNKSRWKSKLPPRKKFPHLYVKHQQKIDSICQVSMPLFIEHSMHIIHIVPLHP